MSGESRAFVGSAANDLVVAITPGEIISFSIGTFGTGSGTLAFVVALLLAIGAFALAAALGFVAAENQFGTVAGGVLAGMTATAIAISLVASIGPSLAMGGVVGGYVLLVQWLSNASIDVDRDEDRRRLLTEVAGVLGFTGIAFLLGRRASNVPNPEEFTPLFEDRPAADAAEREEAIAAKLAEAEEQSLGVDGIPGLVSSIDEFYEVDINRINPRIIADRWTLSVSGAVENPLEISYGDLRNGPVEDRFITLRCVGDALNGQQMDNALWTGIPIDVLLAEARPRGEYVMLRASDSYYEGFSLSALQNGFLAFGMNGSTLPRKHGYPVRAHIPGHWGEINVKWLEEIEVLDEYADGFWEEKGWHGTGPVNTVAKLWAVNYLEDGRTEMGGHAYAGTRGIEAVEASTDGGGSWTRATLSPELDAEDAWRQWVYRFDPIPEEQEVVVRAIDGTGTIQSRAESDPFPSGPSGWVRVSVLRQNR
ncbi:MAG: molybdopterin-dependent oxidoreductase [Halodesulfurarchaeum sp.]